MYPVTVSIYPVTVSMCPWSIFKHISSTVFIFQEIWVESTRQTERANINEDAISSEINGVNKGNLSMRKAADKYNIKPATSQHRLEKLQRVQQNSSGHFFFKYSSRQVFSTNEEKNLNDYITKCGKMHYGLTLLRIRSLAYEYAKQPNCKYPSSWDENNIAGIDWMSSFRTRNKNLSLRKPENTSAARSFGFNWIAINEFFENYRAVLTKYQFTTDRIYNLDETEVTTVMNTPKVLTVKNRKQVGQLISAERGELVTVCAGISTAGHIIPPTFVFPRVHYKDQSIDDGAPEESLGLASRSGWINGDLWLEVLEHVRKHTSCSKEN
ncbi:hypothetical protein JTB14_009240 [Gonioctena quinquepunctata]|nr:hypothetical protein JTB14_009240 [Gonioctena quinquepunctata]